MFRKVNKKRILELADELLRLQEYFYSQYEVDDIFSNSKIFEILNSILFLRGPVNVPSKKSQLIDDAVYDILDPKNG